VPTFFKKLSYFVHPSRVQSLHRVFLQHTFIVKNRSAKVLFDLIQRTKEAVRELDSQIGSRFKKLLVESPAANHHAVYQPAAAAAAADDDDDDDDAADDSSVRSVSIHSVHRCRPPGS